LVLVVTYHWPQVLQCTENFASLIGEDGPNDLVRKFRIGPLDNVADSTKSLLQHNIWPSLDRWDPELANEFRHSIETYYVAICEVAQAIVQAVCDALLVNNIELRSSLRPLIKQCSSISHHNNEEGNEVSSTSMLTLLGYRVGSRHKGKAKGPLVAAHTDVGVMTVLIYDHGDCAGLQRSDGNGNWVDVTLPHPMPMDPVFVVNIADCLADLSGGILPSTLHRVVTKSGKIPRNCCALFLGLDSNEMLDINGEHISYEVWRKRRIERAQMHHTLNKQCDT
jgi:isopenicillin N synthase-like dioxygenase